MPVRSHHHGGHGSNTGDWKLRSYQRRKTHSMLNGATELAKVDNDIEEPGQTTRTVETDGHKVNFQLLKSVTKRPTTSRKERMESEWTNINVHKSRALGRIGHRCQRWLTSKDPIYLTVLYLVLYLSMNAIFAAVWYFFDRKGRCCEDESMTYAQVFDFAVQTSSTIGYGGYWPKGYLNNALVVVITLLSIVLSTVYAGLLFFKFITPQANIEFSDVIAMSNVLGEPCLEVRIGNADGRANALINGEANLWVTSIQEYRAPGEFAKRRVVQTENLHLAVSQVPKVNGVWTIRHFIDEHSPLYGLRLDEFPATTIYSLNLNFKAIQVITKGEVFSQTAYQVEDIMVGYCFEEQAVWDPKTKTGYHDYSKLSKTKPSFVWYPNAVEVDDYEDIRLEPPSWSNRSNGKQQVTERPDEPVWKRQSTYAASERW
mmetsp:Transcript_16096/g.39422  ORF Transcript_16096/g.39422 Transcript_16096/m.39422 type:complete len:429 (-) Transcript_16096:624-1910(-)